MGKFPQKRLLLIALIACLALAALGAEVFVFTHLDHDCEGLECPVCLQIEIAQNVLKGLGLVFIAASLVDFSPDSTPVIKKLRPYFLRLITPISLNIQSNT